MSPLCCGGNGREWPAVVNNHLSPVIHPPNGSSCYHGNRRSQNTGLVGQELLFRHFRDGWIDGDKSSRYTKTSAVSGNQKLLIWEQK